MFDRSIRLRPGGSGELQAMLFLVLILMVLVDLAMHAANRPESGESGCHGKAPVVIPLGKKKLSPPLRIPEPFAASQGGAQ